MKNQAPTILLYCFSQAGGSALVFRDWQRSFPDNVRIRPVELPGRGTRMNAPLLEEYRSLVLTLTREIAEDISSVQRQGGEVMYAGFGHDAGAAINFAVCTRLSQRLRKAPVHCFLSAGLAPHADRKKHSTMDDAALIEEMRARSGNVLSTLGMAELLNFHLPIFRSDCAVYEQGAIDRERRLDCPMTLFAADQDQIVTPETMWSWERYTSYSARRVLLHGDHSSLMQAPEQMIGHIHDTVDYSGFQKTGLMA